MKGPPNKLFFAAGAATRGTCPAPKPVRGLMARAFTVFLMAAVAMVGAVGEFALTSGVGRSASASVPPSPAVLIAGGRHYELQLATTAAEQQRGLSGRARLPASSGLLFVYRASAERCFWMKGMRFRLDIIWLSSADKVVSLQADAPVQSPVFCATSQYVVELVGGQAKLAGIEVGRTVKLEMRVT